VPQVSAVHVYLTAPFVLSWSVLQAMSCGCAIVASNTAPLWEFIDDEVHGLLAEFDDPEEFAAKVRILLGDHALRPHCGGNARNCIVNRWDLKQALKRHLDLVNSAPSQGPSVTVVRKT
jgi:glycosyltransferase involved in cell wall biosynthesis